jgi:hypothetical protein
MSTRALTAQKKRALTMPLVVVVRAAGATATSNALIMPRSNRIQGRAGANCREEDAPMRAALVSVGIQSSG